MASTLKYIILEDSHFMSLDIQKSINCLRPDFELVGAVDSIYDAMEIMESTEIDLIISDTTACEGSVIDIFKDINMTLPLILISEFEEYKLIGQNFNMVDFILKPVSQNNLEDALTKFEKMRDEIVVTETTSVTI